MTAVPNLRVNGLSVRYDALAALSDVTVDLVPGRLIGLIGPNGAGKSTLLRACAALIAPDAGSITLGDRPLAEVPRRERARLIGYLAQDRAVLWPISTARLVALGRLPHLGPWDSLSETDRTAVTQALGDADVAHLAARAVTALSGGELTRVLLARLLAGAPAIILADEPVSGLDPAHAIQMLQIFKALAHAGRTVVVVLHDLMLAARFCDRLILLESGRIAADAPPAEVLTAANLARYYGITAKISTHDGELVVVPWAVG